MDLQEVIPPDSSGEDAFNRFRYQAHVAFPTCANCAGGHGVTSVICEHFEDVCVEEDGRVRFCQIKTRNPEYGLWRLADLCSERGAFRSLLRTHRALEGAEDEREFVYEVILEGTLEREDLIRQFPPAGSGFDDPLAKQVIKLMKPHTELRLAEARQFLERVQIRRSHPRDAIVAINLQVLMKAAPGLSAADLQSVYERTIETICQAMSGSRVQEWPAILFAAEQPDAAKASLKTKRLDQQVLAEVLGPALAGAVPSLQEITDPEALSASALEQKLRLAGAEPELIQQAKQLRANSTRREIELLSQTLKRSDIDAKLEDLRQRLLTAGVASLGLHGRADDSPAAAVFADLLGRLGDHPEHHDPASLYHQDPALLMGGICDLSDQCRFAWRSSG